MSSSPPSKRKKGRRYPLQRHCFVPGCNTGSVKTLIKSPSLFSAPKDEHLRKCWEKAIQRVDKSLDLRSCVCELHFTEDQIVKNYRHVINGQEVLIPKGRNTLQPGAIPSIFPDWAITKQKNSKRGTIIIPDRLPEDSDSPPLVDDDSASSEEMREESSTTLDQTTPFNHPLKLSDFLSVELPKYWTTIEFKNSPHCLVFAVWSNYVDSKPLEPPQLPKPSRMLTLEETDGDITCTVVIGNKINRTRLLRSTAELTTIFKEIECMYKI